MSAFWHVLHLLVWGGCLSFFFAPGKSTSVPGLHLNSPELSVSGSGADWLVKSGKGFLSPVSFNDLSLMDGVSLEYQGMIWSASRLDWNLDSGQLALHEPVIEEDFGVESSLLELTQKNQGYFLKEMDTSLMIPMRSPTVYPIKAKSVALPMAMVGKLMKVGDVLRKPMSITLKGEPEIDKHQMVDAEHVWNLKARALHITQSRFFLRALFKDLVLTREDASLRADGVGVKWGPLRWKMKNGQFLAKGQDIEFDSGVLFLEEGRMILDRKEVFLP